MYIQDIRVCAECEGSFDRSEMVFTRDCHGIPFRFVCWNCYISIMKTAGYDGEYYDDTDEISIMNIDSSIIIIDISIW